MKHIVNLWIGVYESSNVNILLNMRLRSCPLDGYCIVIIRTLQISGLAN